MKLSNPKDFWSGVMFMAMGAGFAVGAYTSYPMGTGARMGPGYFPFYLGALLAVLGLIIAVKSLRSEGTPVGAIAWKGVFWVTLAIVLYGVLLKPLGMVLSSLVLIFVGSIPSGEFNWKEVTLLYVILIVLCVATFVYGLKLPIGLWPEALG